MKIAMGSDHAGFGLKEFVVDYVKELGHEVIDFGTNSCDSVDFSDFALKAAQAVASKQADRGILLCGSGVGVCVTANKVKGILACVCHDTYSAGQGVAHDDMNVLCLGGRVIGPSLAQELVKAFLGTEFEGKERQLRRVNKIKAIEEANFK
ncbi:ribose 5-phosphate isomerase B [Elusimicrobium posterum]|uniref:ribose 5-phosphate isomerase B n=1 Tax=Elusimicrobium posterum TaxID=3116653 RepID=UPI003C7251F6